MESVLVHSGCYNKNTTGWVVCKQQKCISQSFGGWEVRDQGASRLCLVSLLCHTAEGARELSGVSL